MDSVSTSECQIPDPPSASSKADVAAFPTNQQPDASVDNFTPRRRSARNWGSPPPKNEEEHRTEHAEGAASPHTKSNVISNDVDRLQDTYHKDHDSNEQVRKPEVRVRSQNSLPISSDDTINSLRAKPSSKRERLSISSNRRRTTGNYGMRVQSSGSSTSLEPVEYLPQHRESISSSSGHGRTTISRLRVDPTTQEVSATANNTSSSGDIAEEAGGSPEFFRRTSFYSNMQSSEMGGRFVLTRPTNASTRIEGDDYTEVYEIAPSGLSRGEKVSKDQTWRELWLQQKKTSRGTDGTSTESIYGKKHGEDNTLKQRWEEEWTSVDGKVNVNRNVVRNAEDGNVEEEWKEQIVIDEASGTTSTHKEGEDHRGNEVRRWTTDISETKEGERSPRCSEVYSEVQGNISHGRRTTRDRNGLRVKNWYCNGNEGAENETYEDECITNINGDRSGTKKGNNSSEDWNEKWFERVNGDREVDRWSQNEDASCKMGEKYGYSSQSKEEYKERWKRQETGMKESSYIEKWWNKCGERNRWGNKRKTVRVYGGVEDAKERDVVLEEDEVENWHDSAEEAVQQVTSTANEYGAPSNDNTPCVKRQVRRGSTNGTRYSNGHTWGEKWNEVREPSQNHSDTEASGHPVLYLHTRSYDKWWHNGEEGSFGEKHFQDVNTGEEFTEKWYRNKEEWQVDRWEKQPSGVRKGVKYGENQKGVSWHERWEKDGENETILEKSWTEVKKNDVYKWGERSEASSASRSTTNWNESIRDAGNFYERSKVFWEDDRQGNVKTEKEGRSWKVNGDSEETTNWYFDSYGECEASKEKWAYKRGYTNNGDQWTEKWNEFPNRKVAHKMGSNGRGDEWREEWREELTESDRAYKWAEKSGKNATGDEWNEEWVEHGSNKYAKKRASNNKGESWEEQWQESEMEDGAGEKWASKWSSDNAGNRHGKSWGDRWGAGGKGGHRWGEEWSGADVRKWWYDTDGRPPGC